MIYNVSFFLAIALYFIQKALSSYCLSNAKRNGIPAGPMRIPILGSFLFFTRYPELLLDLWAHRFGPLYSLWLGNQLVVVLSDPQVVKDLTVTNGAIFSSRKESFIKCQIIYKSRGVTATPYDDRWRKHRRLATKWLNRSAVDGYTRDIDCESMVLIRDLYHKGGAGRRAINPQPYAGRCSLNIMLSITFGIRTQSIDDPLVARVLHISRKFMNCTGPVSNLTDYLPILRKFPNSMISQSQRLHENMISTYGGFILDMHRRMKRGEQVPNCLAHTLLQVHKEEELDQMDMTMLCSAFMIGGVETTASIIQWFLALMPGYPEIQAKAHAELDRVVGREHPPTVEDEKDLPYVHAIIKEVERCHNPFWLGTPHYTTQDSTYRGQVIPKDTVVILNTYTMHHDPHRHPQPFKFYPERYLNDPTLSSQSANGGDPYKRDHWIFGVGRRICPGVWLAEREIWLAISRILWAFDIEQATGETINLTEYDGLSGRSPMPFKVKMIPRHENVVVYSTPT